MRSNTVFISLAVQCALALAAPGLELASREVIPAKGGWSLQMPTGSTCPTWTSTCFSNQTGVYDVFDRTGVNGTFSRGQECCPKGTDPELFCGTYVNNGQPYACCPIGNADCRGDVEDPTREGNEECANPGWALWQIPDGDKNMFCCLPDQYGYYSKALGQDAIGQCQNSPTLPTGATPAVQFNNGDGSVSPNGTQLEPLPTATPTPAPTCDIVHYGWSLQVDDASECTAGSELCSYGGACCPSGLTCGTVIGPSEVPVCCPPGNPDCRGDVEGLWPQVCADSSWALWHVNTNGNHFCCLPGQVGFNVPGNNSAVGFCGSAVPNGTMRSILDYEGDGSTAGSFLNFPCDSSPAPNASYSSISSAILNPAPTLNPSGIPLATGIWSNGTYPTPVNSGPAVTTLVKPWLETVYTCPYGSSETVAVIHSLSNGIPVTSTSTLSGYGGGATQAPNYGNGAVETFVETSNGVLVTGTKTVGGVAATGAGVAATTTSVFTGAGTAVKGSLGGVVAGLVVAVMVF